MMSRFNVSPRWSLANAVAACVALVLGASMSATAQQRDSARAPAVLRGRVIRSDGSPIAGTDVWLVARDAHSQTDSSGAFRFAGVPAGVQLVEIRHLGFDVRRDTVMLSADHENVRTYALLASGTTLDTVHTVSGQQKYISGRLNSFEERRLSGQGGHFIPDSTFRHNENTTMANIVASHIPGVALVSRNFGMMLVSQRKPCKGLTFLHSKSCSAGVQDCYVAVYLDGVLYYSPTTDATPPDLSRVFTPGDFAGAEYYADGASAPAAMHSNDDGCGSLWLWTRER
jgi:hypothetical protein